MFVHLNQQSFNKYWSKACIRNAIFFFLFILIIIFSSLKQVLGSNIYLYIVTSKNYH